MQDLAEALNSAVLFWFHNIGEEHCGQLHHRGNGRGGGAETGRMVCGHVSAPEGDRVRDLPRL